MSANQIVNGRKEQVRLSVLLTAIILLSLTSCAPIHANSTSVNLTCQSNSSAPIFLDLKFGCSREAVKRVLEENGFSPAGNRIYSNKYNFDTFTGVINQERVVVLVYSSKSNGLESIAVSPQLAPLKDSELGSKFGELNSELSRKYGAGTPLFSIHEFDGQADSFYKENLEYLRGKVWRMSGGKVEVSFIITPTAIKYPNNHNLSWFIVYESDTYNYQSYSDRPF